MHRCTALQNIKDQNWRNPAAFNTITLNVANWQTGYANVTRIIGVKLNTQKVFHTNSCTEIFAPFINVVVDDTLLKTIPHFNYVLLQFINIMNLLDPLLRFSTYFVVNRVQICDVGRRKVWWNERRCRSSQRVDCLVHLMGSNIVLLED